MPEINVWGQTVNDPLPDWQGARKLPRASLMGRVCRLETLDASRHAADLYEAYALGDDSDWTWMKSNVPESPEDTFNWLNDKIMDDSIVPFAVVDNHTEQAVGQVCYMAIDQPMGVAAIGHVTWSRKMRNSPIGTEAIWLLLKNGFEHGYRRMEWKCDSMNVASRRAAQRLGFIWEARLRQRFVRLGRNRDSDILSIIDSEWPEKDAALRAWLSEDNFDKEGRQLKKLEAFRL